MSVRGAQCAHEKAVTKVDLVAKEHTIELFWLGPSEKDLICRDDGKEGGIDKGGSSFFSTNGCKATGDISCTIEGNDLEAVGGERA